MQLTTFVVASLAAAATVSANPIEARGAGYCPVRQCVVDTSMTYYNYANLRPNACNTKPALKVLYDGDVVYDLGTKYKAGCGYYYTQVLYQKSNGKNLVGWMDVNALNCDLVYPPPAAAAAATYEEGSDS